MPAAVNKLKIVLRVLLLMTLPVFLCTYVYGDRLCRYGAERALKSAFPGSEVAVRGAALRGRTFEMKGVRVKKADLDFECEEIQLYFFWLRLPSGKFSKVWINGASLSSSGASSLPLPKTDVLQVSELLMDRRRDGSGFQGKLSFVFDFRASKFFYVSAEDLSVESGDLRVRNARLTLDASIGGLASAEEISFKEIRMEDVRGPFRSEGGALVFGPLKVSSPAGAPFEGSQARLSRTLKDPALKLQFDDDRGNRLLDAVLPDIF